MNKLFKQYSLIAILFTMLAAILAPHAEAG